MGSRIQILIDGQETTGVSYVSVYIANKGVKKLKNLRLLFAFSGAFIYRYKWRVDSIYSSNFNTVKVYRDAVELEISYMDGNQAFEGIFLLAQYTPGTARVEATSSEEEVELERYENSDSQINNWFQTLVLMMSGIALGFLFSRAFSYLAELANTQQSQ